MAYHWRAQASQPSWRFKDAAIAELQTGGGTPPGRPSHSADPTPGDGQLVLHLTAAAPGDVLYPLWRTGSGTFTEPNDSFKRIGTGALAITGLVNDGASYGVVVVAKVGGLWSLPSAEAFGTPTAGTTTPEGSLALPAEYFRELQAQSATWQGWCGAADPAEAKDHIYKVAVPGLGSEIANKRPFSLVDQGSKWDRLKVAGGSRNHFEGSGDILWMVEAEIPQELQADDKHDQAQDWFMNRVGKVVDEMLALAGSGSYLCVNRISLADGPARSAKKVKQTEGVYFQAVFTVEWGI